MSEYLRAGAGGEDGAQLTLGADEYSRGTDKPAAPPAPGKKRGAPKVLAECQPGDVVWISSDLFHSGAPIRVRVTAARGEDRMCRPLGEDDREGEATTLSGALRVVRVEVTK